MIGRWLWVAALLVSCADGQEHTISVFTAASLAASMRESARAFERTHPDVQVRIVVAGSQVLRRQLEEGAPADLFAPASFAHAEAIAGRLGALRTLTCNEPVIVVPPTSPVRSFADLARLERIVVGVPEVPIGAYTERMLARAPDELRAEIVQRIASRELDVRQVLMKVALGEADAGIVYRTDAIAAGESVRAVSIDEPLVVAARYPVALANESAEPERAGAFLDFLTGAGGRAILDAHGFSRCDRGRP